MAELKSLMLAVDMATRQRDEAGQRMATAQKGYDGAREQMDQLQSYAADTEARWSVTSQASATPQIVRHYYQFMDRLAQAIKLQDRVMADLQQRCLEARRVLLVAEVRIAGLNKVLEQRRAELARVQAGREQKQTDEFAAQQHRRQQAEMATRDHR